MSHGVQGRAPGLHLVARSAHPIDLGIDYLFPHAYAMSSYLLTSGKAVNDGDTIDLDGKTVFRTKRVERGYFTGLPTVELNRV